MKKIKWQKLLFYIPLLIIMTISLFLMIHAKLISPLFQNNFLKQSIFFLFGLTILLFKDKLKIKWMFEYSFIFYLLNIVLLILVLFLGDITNGARAWFKFGFFSFQPSEVMKLTLCLYLAHFTSKQNLSNKKQEFFYLIKVLLIVLIPSILVFLEPDTGAILFYILIAGAIIFSSKISKKWFFSILILLLFFITMFFGLYFFKQDTLINIIGTSFFYRVDRLLNFQKGMQIEHALTAIGSAPFFAWNVLKTGIYIPEAPTDFAFALTSNVFGIFGNIIVLICYFLMDWYLLNLWKNQQKNKVHFFTSGFLCMFFINQFQNIFMNIGLMPIMGIPLPFLSYGGSTIVVYFLFLVIILKKDYHR